jgi:hypothetical protein
MSEIYLGYSLDTPLGTLNFNPDPNPGLYLSDVAGLDGASMRANADNLPQRDGAYVYDSLRGARYPVLSGEIRVLDTLANRLTAMEQLVQYTDSIRRSDGLLRWTPTGLTERGCTVRLLDAITITGVAVLKTFQIPLIAADSKAYATTQSSVNRTGTGSLAVTPGGTADTYPVITIHGAITNPVVTNTLTGEKVDLTGITIGTAASRVIDCKNETVVDGGGVNKISDLVPSTTTFFPLYCSAANSLSLAGTGTDANTKLTVNYSTAYV